MRSPLRCVVMDDRTHEDVGELLRRTTHQMRTRWMALLEPLEVTPHQFRALRVIVAGESLRLSELAERLRVANRSVTDVVDALVERGLVERGSVEGDRRAIAVTATADGRALLDRGEALRTADSDDFLGRLTTEERSQLAGLLHKLVD